MLINWQKSISYLTSTGLSTIQRFYFWSQNQTYQAQTASFNGLCIHLNSQTSCFLSRQFKFQQYPTICIILQQFKIKCIALNYFSTYPPITSTVIFILLESAVYEMLSQSMTSLYQFQPSEKDKSYLWDHFTHFFKLQTTQNFLFMSMQPVYNLFSANHSKL